MKAFYMTNSTPLEDPRGSVHAVPVVDESGAPVGMVSEGDLIPRRELEREARRDWWLDLLAEGEALSPDFLANLKATPNQKATDVMTCPVVTVHPDINVAEIARLLAAHRIKRVPVVQDGRVVGIVSRADLLRQSDSRVYSTMTAFNVMNPNVVSVALSTLVPEIAGGRVIVARGALKISQADSRIPVYVVPTDEERMIAEHTLSVLWSKRSNAGRERAS
jgi:CBS domain-containing protein